MTSGAEAAAAVPKVRRAQSKTVTFGDVQIEGHTVTSKVKYKNVQSGQLALERAAKGLSEPGISISFDRSVPVYFADEENPALLIRELNGRRSKGIFQNGRFKAVL